MQCEHCNAIISPKNWSRHILTNKNCLSLQSESKTQRVCKYCSRTFTRNDSLNRHEGTCPNKLVWYEKRTVELENKLAKTKLAKKFWKDRCETLDKKPTTTITNITNIKLEQVNIATIEPFTADTIRTRLDEFNFKMFSQGYKGIVSFVRGIIMKEDEKNYVVTDPSRNAFHRLIDTRDWKRDPNGMFLDILLDELRPKIYGHYDTVLDIMRDARTDDERDAVDQLLDQTKPVYFGAKGDRGSKDREELRQKLRNDVKKIVTI